MANTYIATETSSLGNSFRPDGTLRRASAAILLLLAFVVLVTRAAGQPARSGADRQRQTEEMLKWYAKITFFGEEETGAWSLRIYDKDVTEPATIKYTELWKLDPDTVKWVKIDAGAPAARIVLPGDKPADAPPETQVIGDLPIQPNSVGLFYAKWVVNNSIEGGTMTRIGPGLVGQAVKDAAANKSRVPEGYLREVVPISLNEARQMDIPDPRMNTGQPLEKPTTQPRR